VTVSELYQNAVEQLAAAAISDPELEASFLLGHLLNKTRAELLLFGSASISKNDASAFKQCLSRRLDRIPLAYVIGEQEFWSLPFFVNPHVLIPRPETEQLLDIVFKTLEKQCDQPTHILDFGTGSGVIASLLALKFPKALVVAVDRSMAALRVAQKNFNRHDLADRVVPICGSWGQAIKHGKWDLLVSNPPYVAHEAMHGLQLEVQKEPVSALDGGKNGMEEISKIAGQLDLLLKPKGWFFMEIGFDQKEFVLDLFHSMPYFKDVQVHADYAGLPRVLQARKRE
jgi:release factor glutamine methyltransferase